MKAVIVLGMHRSGTSTASGTVYLLGLDLGKASMGGNENNPRGFFENYRILNFNEALFRKLGVNWHNTLGLKANWWVPDDLKQEKEQLKMLILDDYTSGTPLLFKDPRLCLLLPLYLEVFKTLGIEPFFVITYRKPVEVVESLHKRNSFSFEKSYRIWLEHMFMAEKYSRDFPRIFINYEEMLANPLALAGKMAAVFSLDLTFKPEVGEQIIGFVEQGLNHFNIKSHGEIPEDLTISRVSALFRQFTLREGTTAEKDELDRFSDSFFAAFSHRKWPKVTVVTYVNDNPAALEKTIRSIVVQDYPNLESVVIDPNPESQKPDLRNKFRYLLSCWYAETDYGRSDSHLNPMFIPSGIWILWLKPGDVFTDTTTLWNQVRLLPENSNSVPEKCIIDDRIFWRNCKVLSLVDLERKIRDFTTS